MKQKLARALVLSLAVIALLSPLALAAIEDFTTWTEVDPGSDITVAADSVSWADIRHDYTEYVIEDHGTDNITSSLSIDFEMSMGSSSTAGGEAAHFGVADALSSIYDMDISNSENGIFVVSWQVSSPSPYYRAHIIEIDETGGLDRSAALGISLDTTYYATFELLRSVGDYGTAYLYLYTDASRETLLGTITETLDATRYYRYYFACNSFKNPVFGSGNYKHYGSTGNMEITDTLDPPTITTDNASDIEYDWFFGSWEATLHGTVTSDGGEPCSVGFYYRESPDGEWQWANAAGVYATGESAEVTIPFLEAGQTYDFYARAANAEHYATGATDNFTVTEPGQAPDITTLAYPISVSTDNLSAVIYGQVLYDGADNVTGYFYWRETGAGEWNVSDNTTDLVSGNTFSANITDLSLDIVYQFQAAGLNEYGEGLGGIATFTLIEIGPPTVETVGVSFIQHDQVYMSGNLTDMGNDPGVEVWFQYREVGGHVWSSSHHIVLSEIDTFLIKVTGLTPLTNYEFRAVAKTSLLGGESYLAYGDILAFNTLSEYSVPVMITGQAYYASEGYVAMVCEVSFDGGSAVAVHAEYRPEGLATWSSTTTTYGVVTAEEVTLYASGLFNDQDYEYRAVGVNQYGTGYGSIREFYLTSSTVTTPGAGDDGDGAPSLTGNWFIDWFNDLEYSLGLDNTFGHWVFMFLIMFPVALLFIIFIAVEPRDYLKKVYLVVMVFCLLSIFGAFIFTGRLGIWPVVILIFAVVGLVIVFGGRILSHGRA